MTNDERQEVLTLVPYMQSLPGDLCEITERVRELQRTFHGVDVELTAYIGSLKKQLDQLEDRAGNAATKAVLIARLVQECGGGDDE